MWVRVCNLVLTACFGFGFLINSAHAQQTVKIGLAVANNNSTVPIYAAQTLGYFQKVGLSAEITTYRGGAAAQQALSVGAEDLITYYDAGVGLAVKAGAKEKMVATVDAAPDAWHLLVAKNSPFQSIKDLAGKRIGVTGKASTSDALALWAAQRAGIHVQTVPVGAAGLVPLLKSRQVDAVVIPPPQSLEVLADDAGRSLMNYGTMDPTLPDVWVASEAAMQRNPELVRKTLAVFFQALAYMRKNPQWALAYLKERTKVSDDRVLKLVYDQGTMKQSSDGVMRRAWVMNGLQLGISSGMTALQGVDPDALYTNEYLPSSK